ncbi:hypothetical protein SAMN04487948_105264 [Halogranum amylolyticum]|uniref:DUF5658 domain-containing protein n=1 Tax=Halogranum amylolyticum TaxID=660520 RepID=A0A1H8SRC3_9EURY|nr:hypothetical protein [Halogranum amylolyticum]SEO80878.1 hypothetical protein SAMN04487948_105264 [Halogranum amylolyticum]
MRGRHRWWQRHPSTRRERRIEEYWSWLAVSLFLLVTVDLLTSIAAAAVVGVGAESNPLMAWLLRQELPVLVGVHVAVVVLVSVSFAGVVRMLRRTPDPHARYFAFGIELWLGSLLAVGLFVFANNLSVVVHGASLL